MKNTNNESSKISDEEIRRLMEKHKNEADALKKILKSLDTSQVNPTHKQHNKNKK